MPAEQLQGRLLCNVATPTFRQGLLSVRDTAELSLHWGALSWRLFSDHSSAVVLSFRARIRASGPCTCCLHSYKASGKLQCNVATLRDFVRTFVRPFPSTRTS